jgi:FkbH-like protein
MDAIAAISDLTADKLIKTRWTFGVRGGIPNSDRFSFAASGKIAFYGSPNEVSWTLNGGELLIYRSDDNLMWRSVACDTGPAGMRILLQAQPPFNPALQYQLTESDKTGQGVSDADYRTPKDLLVTPTRLQRVLLIGSCLSEQYKANFSSLVRETVFDHILFNFVREMPEAPPAPITDYGLVLIQLPLHFVLTERAVWAVRLNEPGFLDKIFDESLTIIDAMLDAALRFNRTSGILTLVSNFMIPQATISTHMNARGTADDLTTIVSKLNDYIANKIAALHNVFLLDADAVAASIGKRYVLDDMIYFHLHSSVIQQYPVDATEGLRAEPIPPIDEFYPTKRGAFFAAIFDQMIAQYRIAHQIDQVKAVIFDLDNTLWRGQIAEHYGPGKPGNYHRGGWPMGVWEVIHHLRARGILVAVCSKNDLRAVEDNWDLVVDPLYVKLSDFVSGKINWRNKSENILEICREFGLTPKSVVLVDDNPVERAAVQAAIPDLRVIGANPYLTRRILLWAPETQVAHLSTESARREDMVRSQIVREGTRASLTREQFLASLACTVTFVPIQDSHQKEFARVLELVNKTNQFNTTGKRWTNADMNQFFAEGGRIAAFRAKDKFADYGLIGAIFTTGTEIVQFVMSCRVLGMEIEQYAVSQVVAQLRSNAPNAVTRAQFRETGDNTVCRDVFAKVGFSLLERNGPDLRFEMAYGYPLREPSHIKLAL